MTNDADQLRRWRSPRGQLPRGPGRFAEPTTFLIVFTSTILVVGSVGETGSGRLVLGVAGTLGLTMAALVYRSGIRIEGDALKKDGLLGVRNKPPHELAAMYGLTDTNWRRDEISLAIEGKVVWGRSLVTGVRIVLKDGTSFGLPYNCFLGHRRRQEWIRTIQNWADSNE